MARNSKAVDSPTQDQQPVVPPWKMPQAGEQAMPAVDPPLLDPLPPAGSQAPATVQAPAIPVQRPAGMLPDEVQQHIAQMQKPQQMGSTDVELPGMKVAKLAPLNDGKVTGSVVGRHAPKGADAVPVVQRFRVVGSPGMIAMNGRMVRVQVGKVVDETGYDLKRLRQQGVQLQAVTDVE